MSEAMLARLFQALLDTIAMVGISVEIALLAGIPIPLFLVLSAPGGILAAPRIHRAVAAVINGFRAAPFIVLLVALLPLTRLITGTTIGVPAAIVPLAISATPFFARTAEVSLREVDSGLIEAAQAIGCRRRHSIRHVLLPEALPSLVGSFTITVVTMIGASAMAARSGRAASAIWRSATATSVSIRRSWRSSSSSSSRWSVSFSSPAISPFGACAPASLEMSER